MSRKTAREATMKLLYQMDLNKDFSDKSMESFIDYHSYVKDEKQYIVESILSIIENKISIDKHIERQVDGWSLERIAKVDLAILRIAINEILYRDDIPVQVSINEAVEIAKKYSTADSFKFVNGILGNFVRSMEV